MCRSSRPCAVLFHVRCRKRVRTSAPARVDPVGGFEDPGAMAIESAQPPLLVYCGLRIDMTQRFSLHEERNLERFVIGPEAHAALPGIVAPAFIGKAKRHPSHHGAPFRR